MSQKKYCPDCETDKKISEFRKRSDRDSRQHVCKDCLRTRQTNSRRRKKKEIIDFMGGECERCGYSECMRALEFHHVDPSNKEFSVGRKIWTFGFKKIKEEAKKCKLLCSNCHREIECENPFCNHTNESAPEKRNQVNKDEFICEYCDEKFLRWPSDGGSYCSIECCNKDQEKINWPKTEWIEKMSERYSFLALSRRLGVSDNAIRKRIKNH